MNYFKNIEELIVENEASKRATALKDNSSTLLTYWSIDKLIVEAQGGEKRAKYGDTLINEWGKKLSLKYGNCEECVCFICNFQYGRQCHPY